MSRRSGRPAAACCRWCCRWPCSAAPSIAGAAAGRAGGGGTGESPGRWVWPSAAAAGRAGLLHGRAGVAVSTRPGAVSGGGVGLDCRARRCSAARGVRRARLAAAQRRGRLSGPATPAQRRRAGSSALGRLRSARRELRPDLYQATSAVAGPVRPGQCGMRIGRRDWRGGMPLWSRADRTVGVFGPQGCGKSLDLLLPALIGCPGPALVTLTKPQDLLLVWAERARGGRPVLVLDPFDLVPGLPQLVWDPIDRLRRCRRSRCRRAKAFAAGTIRGAVGRRRRGRGGPVLRRRGGQGAGRVLPRRRADRPQPGRS